MRGNPHVRFGGRAEETDRLKGQHRASVRSDHTSATLLLAKNVHPRIVQERLGHSGVSVTLDTYSHVTPTMQRQAADAFDDLLAGNGDERT